MHQWVNSADEAITSTRRNVLSIFLSTDSKHNYQCLSTLGHYALRGIRAAELLRGLALVFPLTDIAPWHTGPNFTVVGHW